VFSGHRSRDRIRTAAVDNLRLFYQTDRVEDIDRIGGLDARVRPAFSAVAHLGESHQPICGITLGLFLA